MAAQQPARTSPETEETLIYLSSARPLPAGAFQIVFPRLQNAARLAFSAGGF